MAEVRAHQHRPLPALSDAATIVEAAVPVSALPSSGPSCGKRSPKPSGVRAGIAIVLAALRIPAPNTAMGYGNRLGGPAFLPSQSMLEERQMLRITSILAATVALWSSSIVIASATPCSEHIATIERRLNSAGAVAVTGSTTGQQPVAQGSPKALTTPPPGPASTGDSTPTPQRLAAARAAIDRAKDFERQGNQAACDDAMSEAKQLLGALP
jgi:hypothetical protein